MSIVSRFTVTPLLYAIGVLLLVIAGMGVKLALLDGARDSAVSAQHAAEADTRAARTERDAWKQSAQAGKDAITGAQASIASLKQELARAQGEVRRISTAGQRAVAAAQADAADADRTLKLFTAKFQTESRKPDCARALDEMQAVCSALEGY